MRRVREIPALALALVVGVAGPSVVFAADSTAPTGTLTVQQFDPATGLLRLGVPATDTESEVTTVEVSGNGTTWASYPYASTIDWPVFEPAAGGSTGSGVRTVRVRWTDAAMNTSAAITTKVFAGNGGALQFLNAPITGQSFTIKPIFGPGRVQPADETCSWELVWGNAAALETHAPNETYGSLFMSGLPDRGYCGPWTFKVPYVQGVSFEVFFNSSYMSAGDEDFGHRASFLPAAGSTERRILSSNLALVQILPNRYSLVLGQSLTYTAYPIGTSMRSDDLWSAYYPGSGADSVGPRYKLQHGGSSFTFTPPIKGTWFVTWNGYPGRPITLNATYDPKVRKPDTSPPNTSAPVQRLPSGTGGGTDMPVSITWSGTDVGWGIARYELQRSLDGGAWTSVKLPSLKATTVTQSLTQGHSARYRVRAVDAYGNVGAWDDGPTFTPRQRNDTNVSITYDGAWTPAPDPDAFFGGAHVASVAGASATMSFTGRDVAVLAAKGPGKGRMQIYVDDVFRTTVDLLSATSQAHQAVFRTHWSASSGHVIRIVVEGTSTRPEINVDAIAYLQ